MQVYEKTKSERKCFFAIFFKTKVKIKVVMKVRHEQSQIFENKFALLQNMPK